MGGKTTPSVGCPIDTDDSEVSVDMRIAGQRLDRDAMPHCPARGDETKAFAYDAAASARAMRSLMLINCLLR